MSFGRRHDCRAVVPRPRRLQLEDEGVRGVRGERKEEKSNAHWEATPARREGEREHNDDNEL